MVNTTGTESVCLNMGGTVIRTSMRTLTSLPDTFFSSILELPSEQDCLTIDLDFSPDAVQVLLTTLRAARSNLNLAFRAVQLGLVRCGVEVNLLFDYVGLAWLLPTHLPSEFDEPSQAMAVHFDFLEGGPSKRDKDMAGVLRFIHATSVEPREPLCAVVSESKQQLSVLEIDELATTDRAFACGKITDMPLNDNLHLILDFGTGRALYPTGLVLWIVPSSSDQVLFLTVTALSEISGQSKVILKSHIHRSEMGTYDLVFCRLPVSPSLRELYRMFRLTLEFERRYDDPAIVHSSLAEIELFGDYMTCLIPDVLAIQPPRFHFHNDYARYKHGVFETQHVDVVDI